MSRATPERTAGVPTVAAEPADVPANGADQTTVGRVVSLAGGCDVVVEEVLVVDVVVVVVELVVVVVDVETGGPLVT